MLLSPLTRQTIATADWLPLASWQHLCMHGEALPSDVIVFASPFNPPHLLVTAPSRGMLSEILNPLCCSCPVSRSRTMETVVKIVVKLQHEIGVAVQRLMVLKSAVFKLQLPPCQPAPPRWLAYAASKQWVYLNITDQSVIILFLYLYMYTPHT